MTPDGRRLAKRDGSIKLATLREQGVDPRRLIGTLVQSCGWSGTIVPSWPAEWVSRFEPRRCLDCRGLLMAHANLERERGS